MALTTETAKASGTQIEVTLSGDMRRINEMIDSTNSALATYFPTLYAIPDITRYCMTIWQMESGFNCFPNGVNSRHTLIVNTFPIPDDKKLWNPQSSFADSYWNDPLIYAYRQRNGTPESILDGLYAHGISAVMGAYHVDGCNACLTTMGSPRYRSISIANGLLVQPGTAVTSIYTEDKAGRKKSIVAGLILLDYHFSRYVGHSMTRDTVNLLAGIGDTTATVSSTPTTKQAILLAAGAYLGWGKDVNNSSGVFRAVKVRDTTSWTYSEISASRLTSAAGTTSAKTTGCV